MLQVLIPALVAAASAAAQAGIAADTAAKQKAIADQLGLDYKGIPLSQYGQANLPNYNPKLPDVPTNIDFKTLTRDPETRQKVMDAIQQILHMSDKSIQSKGDLERETAAMDADQAAGAKSGAIRNSMLSSGRGGSGLQYGLIDQENQDAANRRYQGGLKAASDADNSRLSAFKAYSDSLGQNEGVDLGIQSKNADTVNSFNTLNAQRRDSINQRIADMTNDASKYNTGIQQWNVLRNDTNSNNTFQQQMAKEAGVANAMGGKSVATGDEGANYAAAVGTLGKMAGQYLTGDGKKKNQVDGDS
jgi:hypothetical protein